MRLRQPWHRRAWNDSADHYYDRGDPDDPQCPECGRVLEGENIEVEEPCAACQALQAQQDDHARRRLTGSEKS